MVEDTNIAPVLSTLEPTATENVKKPGRPKRSVSQVVYDETFYAPRGGSDSPKMERAARRRTKTTRFDNDFLDNEEKRLLQQALKNSLKETKRVVLDPVDAPVFYPTLEEFKDTLGYINKIRPQAETFGICKIVPPLEWQPPCQINMSHPSRFKTKRQIVNRLQEGQGFEDGRYYTIAEYKQMADHFYDHWCKKYYGTTPTGTSSSSSSTSGDSVGGGDATVTPPPTETVRPSHEQLAKDYWEMVETNNRKAVVEYGNDLDTTRYMSGFIKPRNYVPLSSQLMGGLARPPTADLTTASTTTADAASTSASTGAAVAPASPTTPKSSLSSQDGTTSGESSETSSTVASSESVEAPAAAPAPVSPASAPAVAPALSTEFYAKTNWNLNNIPSAQGSVLRYLQTPVNGINVPWLYVGMLFATFCWHNEDNYCYSISYNHFGAPKQWYGIAGANAPKMEEVMKDFLMGSFRDRPDLLHYLTTQIPYSLLMSNGVPVCKAMQDPGTFIVTFPKAYHCGFSYGFNCGEAVNFSSFDWLPYGVESVLRYRTYARESVFSYTRLLFTLWKNKKDLSRSTDDIKHLCTEIIKAVEWEIYFRDHANEEGILTNPVELAPNDFSVITTNAANYDDSRTCSVCKQSCVFSCVVCKCSNIKVTCVTDYALQCRCPVADKCLLVWNSNEFLKSVHSEAKAILASYKTVTHISN